MPRNITSCAEEPKWAPATLPESTVTRGTESTGAVADAHERMNSAENASQCPMMGFTDLFMTPPKIALVMHGRDPDAFPQTGCV